MTPPINEADPANSARRLVSDIALFCRTAFWLFAACLVVYSLFKSESSGPLLIDIGICGLFVIAAVFVFFAVLPRRAEARKMMEVSVKDWASVKIDVKYFALLAAISALGLGIWLAHEEGKSVREYQLREKSNQRQNLLEQKRMEAQERLAEGTQRPGYVTDDEWKLILGVQSYRSRDYDKALRYFSEIKRLDREGDLVHWKFYESMAKLRILEHQSFRRLQPIDSAVVKEISASFSELERRFPLDKHAESVLYWHGQLKYQFERDAKGAQERFSRILNDYKYGQWRQGSLYYSAEILAKEETVNTLREAEALLQVLASRYPTTLVRIVEEGVDRRVEEVVPDKLRQVRERISLLESKAPSSKP